MVGHPEIGGEQSALPLLVGGMLSSDPRLRYHVPHGRSQAEDLQEIMLLRSSSRAGMSGGPVIVPWRDGTRPPAIVGINAGRIRDHPGGDDIFTYAYKSTVILQCIEELRRVP
jgi:hypothetical protein